MASTIKMRSLLPVFLILACSLLSYSSGEECSQPDHEQVLKSLDHIRSQAHQKQYAPLCLIVLRVFFWGGGSFVALFG